jgi:hypothetical protein
VNSFTTIRENVFESYVEVNVVIIIIIIVRTVASIDLLYQPQMLDDGDQLVE